MRTPAKNKIAARCQADARFRRHLKITVMARYRCQHPRDKREYKYPADGMMMSMPKILPIFISTGPTVKVGTVITNTLHQAG